MNNKSWYVLFSVLILLMVGYVISADFGVSSPLNLYDVNITLFQENSSDVGLSINNDVLANGTVLIAKLITLNVTYSGNTTSTNVTWYLDNSSDNAGWVIIAASNGSAGAESATADNATGWGRFNLATQIPWATDLNASNLTARGRYVDIIVNVTNRTLFVIGYTANTFVVKKLQLLVYPNELTGEPFANNTVLINGQFSKGGTQRLNNITEKANLSGTVRFNASLAVRNTTTNATWYAISGGSSPKNIVLGSVNQIDNLTLDFNTGNGTLADGRYNITLSVTNLTNLTASKYVYANQTVGSGYWNTTVFNVLIDNTAPSLSIGVPANNSNFTTRSITLNFTVSDTTTALNSCWYNLNFASSNTTISSCSNLTITAQDGRNNITVYANDSVDNLNTSLFVEFTVDLKDPNAKITLSDSDGIVYTRATQKGKCDFSENGGTGLDESSRTLEFEKPNGDIIYFTNDDAAKEQTFNEIDTAMTGEYKVRCSVKDIVGLSATARETFRVYARGGPSSATTGKKKAVEEVEGEEVTEGEKKPTLPSVEERKGVVPILSAASRTTAAIIVAILVVGGGVIYFLVNWKPGKRLLRKGKD